MTPKTIRSADCSVAERAGRLAQAEGFWRDAEDLRELEARRNSIVSLYVLAGIAAADVVCCAKLGEYSKSENHADAITLIKRADPTLASALQRLLAGKSAAAYGVDEASAQRLADARNSADKLLRAARIL